MARIRYLKPEFFFDDDLALLDFGSRLFFQGLWCYADKAGRLEDKPKVLKAQIMPYDKLDVEKTLEKLSTGFITRYEIEGKKYIQINNFLKHQKPHHTEKDSVIPPSNNGAITVKTPLDNRLVTGGKEEDKGKLKNKNKNKNKRKYLEFVFLSKDEFQKLLKSSNAIQTKQDIRNLNNYLGSTGKSYKSHYHTILNWRGKKTDSIPIDNWANEP